MRLKFFLSEMMRSTRSESCADRGQRIREQQRRDAVEYYNSRALPHLRIKL